MQRFPGNEVHYVNAYFNRVADDLGIPKRNDQFISIADSAIQLGNIKQFKKKVFSKLDPKLLVKVMADSYLNQVKSAQVVDVNAQIPISEYSDVISRNDSIKLTSLNQEFGDVSIENYLSMDEDGSHMTFAKQSTLIEKEFLGALRQEKIVVFDDAVTLSDRSGEGSIKMLGNLFWRDVNGNCEEIDTKQLLELSPRVISETMTKARISKSDQAKILGELTTNIVSSVSDESIRDIPGAWFSDFAAVIRPLSMSLASYAPVVHLAASVCSIAGMKSLIQGGVYV